MGHISTFFEIGGIYTFYHFGTFKNGKNRRNLDLRLAPVLCFFSDGKNGRDPGRSTHVIVKGLNSGLISKVC